MAPSCKKETSRWFAGCFQCEPAPTDLVFLGIADDIGSSFLRGPSEAPPRIRKVYDGRCYGPTTESGVNLENQVLDFGDLAPGPDRETSFRHYTDVIRGLLRDEKKVFIAGGDHAITIPVVEAFQVLDRPVQVIQIDAHPDLYPSYDGSRLSHACTAARLLEMPHVESIIQIGIRCMNSAQLETLDRHSTRVMVVEAGAPTEALLEKIGRDRGFPVYLSIDLDGFDPAFAPGVSHPVPGGLSPRQIFDLFRSAKWELAGMDVVETNPSRDFNDLTSLLAARLLHEGMGYTLK